MLLIDHSIIIKTDGKIIFQVTYSYAIKLYG